MSLSPLASNILALAGRFYRLANRETERLDFDDYANLQEWEAKLNAYGNLLSSSNVDQFLTQEMADAEEFLSFIAYRLGIEEE